MKKASADATLWLSVFVLVQIACQIGLLFEAIGALRVVARTITFGSSLGLLYYLPVSGRAHPSWPWGIAILVILSLGLLHPGTTSSLVGFAQVCLYLAILAPLFWVGRLTITSAVLYRVLQILWGFHTLSAFFGVLQTYFPGRFTPNVSTAIQSSGIADSLKITLANGEQVWRPMGLTDSPGGACLAGYYAFLFGLGFLATARQWPLRLAAVASMSLGMFCIYLSQVRSVFIMALVTAMAFSFFLFYRGDARKALFCGLGALLVVFLGFLWAVRVGGDTVTDRFGTLVADRPDEVYQRNRGLFLEHTFDVLLPEYPLGAGLGRWGVVLIYFGDAQASARALHAEIQLTGWLFDGGVPLILAYTLAIFIACWTAWQIAVSRGGQGELQRWAALILAYNMGAVVVTFNYPVFISQTGMEFWMLNACLFGAALAARQRLRPPLASGRPPTSPKNIKAAQASSPLALLPRTT